MRISGSFSFVAPAYYLKLKEGFFESEEIKILESMKDGHIYSNILLKLYLKSLRNEGRFPVFCLTISWYTAPWMSYPQYRTKSR